MIAFNAFNLLGAWTISSEKESTVRRDLVCFFFLNKNHYSYLLTLFIYLAELHGMWGSWFPDQVIKPVPPEVEAQSPNHWTTREVTCLYY